MNHSTKEYTRVDVMTNSMESYFRIFKRSMTGDNQHCGEQHFQRYINEFSFRNNNRIALGTNNTERAARVVRAPLASA